MHHPQSGSALVYILIGIALLAALTASFMQPASQQTSAQNIVKTVANVRAQSEFIRSSIQECILMYPRGDVADPDTVLTNSPYPLEPTDAYLDTPAGNDQVRHARCPGNPGDSNDHSNIFGGTTGKFLPPAPDLFEEWVYYSGDDGVFFYTRTSKTDAFLGTALERLDDEFAECEADVVTSGGSAVDMTSTASELQCPANNLCFRVWMIATGTATYQAGGDEDTAGCP